MNITKYLLTAIAAVMLTSCSKNTNAIPQQTTVTTTTTVTTVQNTQAASNTPIVVKELPSTDSAIMTALLPDVSFYAKDWNRSDPYVVINNNVPFFSNKDKTETSAFETYSDLDDLGRCGIAYANICKELLPTTEREKIGMVKPSGWQTSKYDKSVISDMYLYNRCHLIAYMLAGENANTKNLITGTRYLNITGMLPFEDKVHDYLEKYSDNHVLYRVTPVYENTDLVAQGVLMEAYSIEDNGSLCFCVYCYNVQPGIDINYRTGDNCLDTNDNTSHTESENKYVLNIKSKKIHRPDCKAANDISENNKQLSERSIADLENDGYSKCKICDPE